MFLLQHENRKRMDAEISLYSCGYFSDVPLSALCWGVLAVEYSVSAVSTAVVSVSAGVRRAVSSSCHPHSGRGPSGGRWRSCFGLKEQVLEKGWCRNSPSRCRGPAIVQASFPRRRVTITVWIFTNSLLTVKWLRVGKMMKVFLVTSLCKALQRKEQVVKDIRTMMHVFKILTPADENFT